jgi:hypothetical protein
LANSKKNEIKKLENELKYLEEHFPYYLWKALVLKIYYYGR